MKSMSSTDACRRFRAHLSELVGPDTPAEVLAEGEAHRALCSVCDEEYRLAMRTEESLSALPDIVPGEPSASQVERLFAATDAGRGEWSLAFDPTQPVQLEISCQEFRDSLGDFVSEELPVGMLLEGVEHASACRSCGDELAVLQTIQDACRSLAEVEPPARIWTSLMARIEAEEAEAASAEKSTTTEKARAAVPARKLLPVLG